MIRRVFCPSIRTGSFPLGPAEAHHLRDVLRVSVGDTVELFDAGGRSARAAIAAFDDAVIVRVETIHQADATTRRVTVASAVPKADRADWLVEKLSELGVDRWIPLKTDRSVVHPAGEAKFDRWRRIAVEAAKQCRRAGVMEIAELTELESLSFSDTDAAVLSTREGSRPLASVAATRNPLLLIGPEGGWTEEELALLVERGAVEASLTTTILRIETAAIAAASAVMILRDRPS